MVSKKTIFVFGEAEKGDFCTPIWCHCLSQLAEKVGNPPEETEGVTYAIQFLLYRKELFFFRVREEGFSIYDYMKGISLLKKQSDLFTLQALCLPGVGDPEVIQAATKACLLHKSILIITERDLYDYLTAISFYPPCA
jgi:hypothetical protein